MGDAANVILSTSSKTPNFYCDDDLKCSLSMMTVK